MRILATFCCFFASFPPRVVTHFQGHIAPAFDIANAVGIASVKLKPQDDVVKLTLSYPQGVLLPRNIGRQCRTLLTRIFLSYTLMNGMVVFNINSR